MAATKQGWAHTFQWIAIQLGLNPSHQNGARRFTGHTARATGAVHLASTQVELWRVQLFGRWGSEVFLHYIREAPVEQLDKLALETSVHISLETAKSELQQLLRRQDQGLSTSVACPTEDMLQDCEAALADIAPPKSTDAAIRNRNGGKIHRALVHGDDIHPRDWKTRCSWKFGNSHTLFDVVPIPDSSTHCCRKCFPEFRVRPGNEPNSDSETSSSSSSSS